MEDAEDKAVDITKEISLIKIVEEHLSSLDLSKKNIETLENLKLPINLTELNLSTNKLTEVPESVLVLQNLKVLNLSHNFIKYFDVTPKFCHTIQLLDISNNDLHGPPYWVWSETPAQLTEINLSCNENITNTLHKDYFKKLLEYKSLVTNIIMYNCRLTDHMELIGTFSNAKSIILGTNNNKSYSLNQLEQVPCNGLNKCCDIEYLNLSNTNISNINSRIDIYRNLKEINLSYNMLDSLPEEFCLLANLEVCILSYNSLYSLPANFCNLTNITNLSLEYNELYILPDICKLPNIKQLDVYDNYLYEVPEGIERLLEVDLAQNYFDEPNDEEYLEKRKLVRANNEYRSDGRKEEDTRYDTDYSKKSFDDETVPRSSKERGKEVRSSSSDWDSDEYWVPHKSFNSIPVATQSPWVYYVKKKMEEGNFCPMDAHTVPIADQVKYARMCNPKVEYESDGQFDDFSGDDSG